MIEHLQNHPQHERNTIYILIMQNVGSQTVSNALFWSHLWWDSWSEEVLSHRRGSRNCYLLFSDLFPAFTIRTCFPQKPLLKPTSSIAMSPRKFRPLTASMINWMGRKLELGISKSENQRKSQRIRRIHFLWKKKKNYLRRASAKCSLPNIALWNEESLFWPKNVAETFHFNLLPSVFNYTLNFSVLL